MMMRSSGQFRAWVHSVSSRSSAPLLAAALSAVIAVSALEWRHLASRQRLAQTTSTMERLLAVRVRVTRAYAVSERAFHGDVTLTVDDAAAELDRARMAVDDWIRERAEAGVRRGAEDRALAALALELERVRAMRVDSAHDDVDERRSFASLERLSDEIALEARAELTALSAAETRDQAVTMFVIAFGILLAGITVSEFSRRRAEAREEAAIHGQRLRLLVEQLPVAVWTVDDALRFTAIEGGLVEPEATTSMIGGSVADVVGRERDPAAEVAAHRRALAGEAVEYDVASDASHLSVRLRPLRNDAQAVVGVVGVAIDMTERARMEELMRTALKMEAIGRLAGGVAHDFNSVLTAVSLAAHELADAAGADERSQLLVELTNATNRGARLVRQLLALGRAPTGGHEPQDLGAIVRDLAPMLHRLATAKVALYVESNDAESWHVAGSAVLLEQVVLNLVTNAIDACAAGGTVRVALRADPETRTGSPRRVVLTVADDGAGMDPDTQARIFDPFFTTKAPGKGTGLGLATVHAIVQQLGGTISVDSQVGRGTTMTIAWPTLPYPAVRD